MFNFYNQFQDTQPPYWIPRAVSLTYQAISIANPAILYLQEQYTIQYMLSDFYSYMIRIANSENILIDIPPNSFYLSEKDKIQFLTYIGNIIGLPFFTVAPAEGFILDTSQLDIDKLGGGINPSDIRSSEYANCLLSRFYSIYSNCSINNIINSIQRCSQVPLSNISLSIDSATSTLNFSINTAGFARSELFIEYLDSNGYNIWMRPQYGLVTFSYT